MSCNSEDNKPQTRAAHLARRHRAAAMAMAVLAVFATVATAWALVRPGVALDGGVAEEAGVAVQAEAIEGQAAAEGEVAAAAEGEEAQPAAEEAPAEEAPAEEAPAEGEAPAAEEQPAEEAAPEGEAQLEGEASVAGDAANEAEEPTEEQAIEGEGEADANTDRGQLTDFATVKLTIGSEDGKSGIDPTDGVYHLNAGGFYLRLELKSEHGIAPGIYHYTIGGIEGDAKTTEQLDNGLDGSISRRGTEYGTYNIAYDASVAAYVATIMLNSKVNDLTNVDLHFSRELNFDGVTHTLDKKVEYSIDTNMIEWVINTEISVPTYGTTPKWTINDSCAPINVGEYEYRPCLSLKSIKAILVDNASGNAVNSEFDLAQLDESNNVVSGDSSQGIAYKLSGNEGTMPVIALYSLKDGVWSDAWSCQYAVKLAIRFQDLNTEQVVAWSQKTSTSRTPNVTNAVETKKDDAQQLDTTANIDFPRFLTKSADTGLDDGGNNIKGFKLTYNDDGNGNPKFNYSGMNGLTITDTMTNMVYVKGSFKVYAGSTDITASCTESVSYDGYRSDKGLTGCVLTIVLPASAMGNCVYTISYQAQ